MMTIGYAAVCLPAQGVMARNVMWRIYMLSLKPIGRSAVAGCESLSCIFADSPQPRKGGRDGGRRGGRGGGKATRTIAPDPAAAGARLVLHVIASSSAPRAAIVRGAGRSLCTHVLHRASFSVPLAQRASLSLAMNMSMDRASRMRARLTSVLCRSQHAGREVGDVGLWPVRLEALHGPQDGAPRPPPAAQTQRTLRGHRAQV